MPSNNPWPPDLQARVIELWNGRYSAGQIALKPEFRGFSRNAVIGQLWRLRKKCPERFLPSRLPGPRPKAKVKHRVKRRRGNPKGSMGPIIMRKITPPSLPQIASDRPGIALFEVAPNGCRYIVSTQHGRTPTHLYCGVGVATSAPGDPPPDCYCDYHRVLMGRTY